LQVAQALQEKRDNRRSQALPSADGTPRKRGRAPGKKSSRELSFNDLKQAIDRLRSG
jgi:hypothetical protein